MSKIMTWYIWMVTYLPRNVTIVRGASYHLLGSWISWDLKIQFQLQVKSYISNWGFSKLQHLASYVSHLNAMAYDRQEQFSLIKAGRSAFSSLASKIFTMRLVALRVLIGSWAKQVFSLSALVILGLSCRLAMFLMGLVFILCGTLCPKSCRILRST